MNNHPLSAASTAALLSGLLLLGGCIENPAADPDLNKPRPQVHRASVDLAFRQSNFLQLRIERDSSRTRLKAVNTGLNRVDSASFLLQIGSGNKTFNGYDFYPIAEFEFMGIVEGLEPGATKEFGVIDTLHDDPNLEYRIGAWLLAVREDGSQKGSSFAGIFTGSYVQWQEGGKRTEGRTRALVDADGDFTYSAYPAGSSYPEYSVQGSLKEDGQVALPFRGNWYKQTGKSGRVTAQDGRYLARFDFIDSISTFDSLEFRYESAVRR